MPTRFTASEGGPASASPDAPDSIALRRSHTIAPGCITHEFARGHAWTFHPVTTPERTKEPKQMGSEPHARLSATDRPVPSASPVRGACADSAGRDVTAARVNVQLYDLARILAENATPGPVSVGSAEGVEVIRHS